MHQKPLGIQRTTILATWRSASPAWAVVVPAGSQSVHPRAGPPLTLQVSRVLEDLCLGQVQLDEGGRVRQRLLHGRQRLVQAALGEWECQGRRGVYGTGSKDGCGVQPIGPPARCNVCVVLLCCCVAAEHMDGGQCALCSCKTRVAAMNTATSEAVHNFNVCNPCAHSVYSVPVCRTGGLGRAAPTPASGATRAGRVWSCQ